MHRLVDVHALDPTFVLDIRYATKNNFVGIPLYSLPLCYLHRDAAKALVAAHNEIKKKGLRFKLFDGYRPLSVQQLFWDHVQDERFVSNPAVNKGRHTRGTAIDLTLVDGTGNELEMPTHFDDFTEKAAAEAPCSEQAFAHRALLRKVLAEVGFEMLPTEWWHFDLSGWQDDVRYPALDIKFAEL